MTEEIKILVVEDDRIIAEGIKTTLVNLGYSIPAVVSSGEEAVKKAEEEKPDLILMDIVLEGEMDGIDAASQIHSRFRIPVVFLTAYSDTKMLDRAKMTEPFGYIVKPFEERELHSTIEIALYKDKIEKKLRESEQWLSTTLRSIGDAVIATDIKSRVTFVNPVAEELTGWKQEEASGKPLEEVFQIINEDTEKPSENPVIRVLKEGAIVGLANHTVLIAKDGTRRPIDDSGAPIKDEKERIIGVVIIFRDISERRKAEENLKSSLKEKEVLLKEIHHRVKNNMQIVLSLLNIQAGHIQDKGIINMLEETKNRVRSMALIHEKLYQSKDLARIEFGEYVRMLASGLLNSYGADSGSIQLKVDVKEVFLDINTAIPCGLIVNELVSNSLKHAFPDGMGEKGKKTSDGYIQIKMSSNGNKEHTLIVRDNGVGFPKKVDFQNTDSLGLQIVNTLVDQLEGTIDLSRQQGTTFTITFGKGK